MCLSLNLETNWKPFIWKKIQVIANLKLHNNILNYNHFANSNKIKINVT